MFIDTHAHLSSEDMLPDIDALLARASAVGICRIVNICTDEPSLLSGIALKKRYPWIANAAAATPHDVERIGDSFFLAVESAAERGDLIAIGETGLDYAKGRADIGVQQEHLLRYFSLARQTGLPLIFHCRDAFSDLFRLADKHYLGLPAVLHCFTGDKLEAQEVCKRGWYLSVSGIATFKKSDALREAISQVPLNRLFVETDTPYLAPQSKRGKSNEPSFIVETIQMLACLFHKSVEEMGEILFENAETFFSFSKRS
ncbi:MAG: TatD family hydrolase [Chlamydiales bacterium]|nr:TatD family hydrolase [Chlamydiales bacterium]